MSKLLTLAVDRQYYFNEFTNPELQKLQNIPDHGILLCGNYGTPNTGDWHIDYRFYAEETNGDPAITVLQYDSDIKSVVDVFMKQDVMVCARYHAILVALSLGIPCVALYYDTHQHYRNKIGYLM